jgi:hypothetical protein
MAADRFVAVVGARALPEAWAGQVAEVVRFFVDRGWGIGSGGARGADEYALRAVLAAGSEACRRSVVFLPGSLADSGSRRLRAFLRRGGRVVEGSGSGREALLARSRRLARESAGVVAFLWGSSRGSAFTLREAARAGKPVAAVLAGGGAGLPALSGGRWEPCAIGPVPAFRWVAEVSEEPAPRTTALARIFVVPDGEPVDALLAHISGLSQGERLWFEQGVLLGDTVLVPHERLDDGKPARLAVDRLMRRLRCSAREAFDLGECLLALEADASVIAHYEAEARRRGVGPVVEDLVHLIASLALAEPVPDADALDHAERLGDRAEWVADDGRVAQSAVQSGGEPAHFLGWHALGSVQPDTVACTVCGAVYPSDDASADLPTCPRCGTRDTWEARQDPAFRALVQEIDGCSSLPELAALGKRLYRLRLSHDQAGVAWTHYQLRKTRLESELTLCPSALSLLAEVEEADSRSLPYLGARLYRLQHNGASVPGGRPSAAEWRRIWQAYRARRPLRPA